MNILEEIKKLMERLSQTEDEKNNVQKEMKSIVNQSINQLLEVMLLLSRYLKKENVTLRSYMGNTFNVGEGIPLFEKSIEEKILLKPDKRIMLYRIENEELREKELNIEELQKFVSLDALYNTVKENIIRCIHKNEQEIMSYKSFISKIKMYNQDIENIIHNSYKNY